jgi:hypothetical protein
MAPEQEDSESSKTRSERCIRDAGPSHCGNDRDDGLWVDCAMDRRKVVVRVACRLLIWIEGMKNTTKDEVDILIRMRVRKQRQLGMAWEHFHLDEIIDDHDLRIG